MCLIKVSPSQEDNERSELNIEAIGTIDEVVDMLEANVNLDQVDGIVSEYLIYTEQKGADLVNKLMKNYT